MNMSNPNPTDKDELREQYPISTFAGATQDELIEFVLGYANQRVKEAQLQQLEDDYWVLTNTTQAEAKRLMNERKRELKATLKESK